MLGSGWFTSEGLILRGVNRTDGIWNIGLIQELKYHFPPEHPGFSEIPLKGYHFLFHLLVAVVSITTNIPIIFLYFQIFPIIISFLWGLGVYKTVMAFTKNSSAAYVSTFVSFFGGSLAFILHILGQTQLSTDSGLGIAQPYGSSLQNPAYASSIVLVIWSIYGLAQYVQHKKSGWLVGIIIFSGVAVGFKAYAGMILMGGLAIAAITRILFEKKFDLLIAFFISLVISIAVFFPFNANYGFLVYAPFLHIIRMIEGPLNFTSWDELFHIQREINNNFGMVKLFSLVFVIFTVGNLSTRIVGIVGFFRSVHKMSLTLTLYITALIGSSFIIPFFFIQPFGGSFNITQMHWYFLFLVSIFTGPGLIYIVSRIKNIGVKYLVIVVFFVLTVPTSASIFTSNITKGQIAVSNEELELLQYFSNHGNYDDTVLIIPSIPTFGKDDLESWFWHDSSVIIPALGQKRTYLSNEVVIYPYEERFERYKVFTAFDEGMQACDDMEYRRDRCEILFGRFITLVQEDNIKLLYVPITIHMPENSKLNLLTQNGIASVYEVLPL